MTEYLAEQENDREYSDGPMQATIDHLRDVIELQAREILRLQRCIRSLELERTQPVYVPGKEDHEPFDGVARSW